MEAYDPIVSWFIALSSILLHESDNTELVAVATDHATVVRTCNVQNRYEAFPLIGR